jgi:hypothetical protein
MYHDARRSPVRRPPAAPPAGLRWRAAWLAMGALALAGCGGGGGGGGEVAVAPPAAAPPPAAASCTAEAQKDWLRSFMLERYYWSGLSPNPEPGSATTVEGYFRSLYFQGNATAPADRWSYSSDTASYEQFFEEGRTLGYGFFVNGNELTLPLKVRLTEARSPAAAAGVQRGDTIVSANGVAAADMVARGDFTALVPAREGDTVLLELEAAGGARRSVSVRAATYELTPVPVVATLDRAGGGKVGYLVLKDFITQAEVPLRTGLAQLRAAGADELILDLRYNGGGRVSTSGLLASLIAGATHQGKVYTELRYSSLQAASNQNFRINTTEPGFSRVVVLTGPRTCSASELVINGLKPFLPVTTIGGATCGKPFGFNPTPNCGRTYSAVNFEAFNGLGEGRYYNGIPAQCPAVDRFSDPLGSPTESMTASALGFLATGACTPVADGPANKQALGVTQGRWSIQRDPGERSPGMWVD